MTHPLSVIDGKTSKNNSTAEEMHRQLASAWGLPEKVTRDGVLADVSEARRLARDPEEIEERFGDENFFLRAAIASVAQAAAEENRGGEEGAFDDLMARAADTANARAGEIESGVVQDSTPIEVDPVIVDIQDSAAPFLEYVDMEAQPGFTAQFNVIDDRGPVQPGAVTEADAVDLSDNDNTDWTLESDDLEMTILTARMNMSDFTQRAWQSLSWGGNSIEETTVGQVMIALARWRPARWSTATPTSARVTAPSRTRGQSRLAWWAQNAEDNLSTGISHVVDKSGLDTSDERARLDDLKSEVTELVTNTGADYESIRAVCGPEFFDTIESEVDNVVRLDDFSEGINYGGRKITIKNAVELTEVRAVGRDEHGGYTYNQTGDTPAGTWDINEGDVFLYDQRTFKRRQLAPLSTTPLARRGLADEAVAFEYKANIDKSHGAHTKFLQAYPTA